MYYTSPKNETPTAVIEDELRNLQDELYTHGCLEKNWTPEPAYFFFLRFLLACASSSAISFLIADRSIFCSAEKSIVSW